MSEAKGLVAVMRFGRRNVLASSHLCVSGDTVQPHHLKSRSYPALFLTFPSFTSLAARPTLHPAAAGTVTRLAVAAAWQKKLILNICSTAN
jgi:hypothetical protein